MVDRDSLSQHLQTLQSLLTTGAPDDALRPVCRLLLPALSAIVSEGDREVDTAVREIVDSIFGAR
jgi:hypothetical protein